VSNPQSAGDTTIAVTFLTSRIGWYVVIALPFVGMGALILALPSQPSQFRPVAALFIVPLFSLILWTIFRELVVHVTVGSDGVYVRELNRRRFLPFSAIAKLVEEENTLTLVLRNGGRQRITTNRARHGFRRQHSARADALVARVRQAIGVHAPELSPAPAAPNALLLRVRALLTEGPAHAVVYRETDVSDVAALQALAADATAAAKTRAAAAVAVRGDPEARACIANLVMATASPSLAALFSAVAARRADEDLLAVLDDVGGDDYDAPISGS
jgi:hypothetical protein